MARHQWRVTLRLIASSTLKVFAALSLVICLACGAAWVASYRAQGWTRAGDHVEASGLRKACWEVTCYSGEAIVEWSTLDNAIRTKGPLYPDLWGEHLYRDRRFDYQYFYESTNWTAWGPRPVDGGQSWGGGRDLPGTHTWLAFPIWAPTACTLLPASILVVAASKRRRRARPGYCGCCGYDTRATPNQCPECGTLQAAERI